MQDTFSLTYIQSKSDFLVISEWLCFYQFNILLILVIGISVIIIGTSLHYATGIVSGHHIIRLRVITL